MWKSDNIFSIHIRIKEYFLLHIDNKRREQIIFILFFSLILFYLLPYYIYGEQVKIRVHDNLDSNLVWAKILISNGYLTDWSKTTVHQIMNGIPVGSLAPLYDISTLLITVFGLFWGYVASKSLMAIVGYAGMWSLLKNFIIPNGRVWIVGGVAACYGILPFWGFNLGVAILPLLFWAFLKIKKTGRQAGWGAWAVMALGGFTSSLILEGVFFIGFCGLWIIYDSIKYKRFLWLPFFSLILLSSTYLISHILIFKNFFNHSIISHRREMDFSFSWIGEIFFRFKTIFLHGQYHAPSLHYYLIPLFILALPLLLKRSYSQKVFFLLMGFLVASSLVYASVNWQGISFVIKPITDIVPIQLGRIHFLQPVAWYGLFAISIMLISNMGKVGKCIAAVAIIFQIIFLFRNFEYNPNETSISYESFYAEELFDQIKADLGDPSLYRVISIGMHPAVSQYNGFYTLDGYSPDYPLEYKHTFKKLLGNELTRAPELNRYFDTWGSRAYGFSAEIGRKYIFNKGNEIILTSLNYDWEVFSNLTGKYIFAPFEINVPELQLLKIYTSPKSAWDVYVYVLKEDILT